MTELINDEAVYRTAPATPGLLKIVRRWGFQIKNEQQKMPMNLSQLFKVSPIVHWKLQS